MSQHSNFRQEPWGRLLRTIDYTSSVIYGGPDLAWKMGRRVREMHRAINGVRPDGLPYHALEPRPYAWVHVTLADAIVRGHGLFCSPSLSPGEIETFWAEWRRMGRLIGVGTGDLPADWPGLVAYFDDMVERELEDTEAAQDVIESLLRPASPRLRWMPESIWRVLRWPPSKAGLLMTLGMLPPVLRERLGVAWSVSQQRRFLALARLTRASGPLMPPQARRFGQVYLRRRGLGKLLGG